MNPENIFPKVIVPESPPRPESPAYDLLALRWRRQIGLSPERFERLVNAKWRLYYIGLYRKENS